MRYSLLLALFAPVLALAQPFSFGVKVGGPLTDAYNAASSGSFKPDTKRFVIGPTGEIRLPFGFGIEVDALYRRYEYNYSSSVFAPVTGDPQTVKTTAGSWEFPVLGKFRTAIPVVKPYVVGGLNFNHLTGIKQALTCYGGSCSKAFNDIAHNSNVGVTVGGGLQINALVLKISPEIRFTRWGVANFDVSAGSGSLKSNQNQADFLVGITF